MTSWSETTHLTHPQAVGKLLSNGCVSQKLVHYPVAKLCLRGGAQTPEPWQVTNVAARSATGTRTRVARVRTEYPDQLDNSGDECHFFAENSACESWLSESWFYLHALGSTLFCRFDLHAQAWRRFESDCQIQWIAGCYAELSDPGTGEICVVARSSKGQAQIRNEIDRFTCWTLQQRTICSVCLFI